MNIWSFQPIEILNFNPFQIRSSNKFEYRFVGGNRGGGQYSQNSVPGPVGGATGVGGVMGGVIGGAIGHRDDCQNCSSESRRGDLKHDEYLPLTTKSENVSFSYVT